MASGGHLGGDTTYTKVFVGGLAWETQKETMNNYFEQFGDILEAVVIVDKPTGRSKGYGFVTFRDAESAMRACVDAAPVIDGRRANCNLASLGLSKSKPSTPNNYPGGGNGGRKYRVMTNFQTAAAAGNVNTAFGSAPTYPPSHYAIQQGIPFNLYGYSAYSPDYTYPTNYYNAYGGAAAGQYPGSIYGTAGGMMTGGFYPYLQFGDGYGSGQGGYNGYNQYPINHQLFQYSSPAINSTTTSTHYPLHYGGPLPLTPPTPPALHSVCFGVQQV